jgi:hypothetical protein
MRLSYLSVLPRGAFKADECPLAANRKPLQDMFLTRFVFVVIAPVQMPAFGPFEIQGIVHGGA